jgi:hypothetical protein
MGLKKITEEDIDFIEKLTPKFEQIFSVVSIHNWSLFSKYLFLVFMTLVVFLTSIFYSLKDLIFLRWRKIPKRFRELYLIECIIRDKLEI